MPSGCSYSGVSKGALFNTNPAGRSSSKYELLCLDERPPTAHAGDVGLRTAVIPIADYNGFDFELVALTLTVNLILTLALTLGLSLALSLALLTLTLAL